MLGAAAAIAGVIEDAVGLPEQVLTAIEGAR